MACRRTDTDPQEPNRAASFLGLSSFSRDVAPQCRSHLFPVAPVSSHPIVARGDEVKSRLRCREGRRDRNVDMQTMEVFAVTSSGSPPIVVARQRRSSTSPRVAGRYRDRTITAREGRRLELILAFRSEEQPSELQSLM